MIGALGSISKGANTWFGKLVVPTCSDFLGSVQFIGHPWNCSPAVDSVVTLNYGELLRHNKHYPVEHLTTGENQIIIIIIIIIITTTTTTTTTTIIIIIIIIVRLNC